MQVKVRELKKDDLFNGFLTTLDSLRQTSNIKKQVAEEIFDKINSNPDHIIAVAVADGKVVGSTTLLIETKFIHQGGIVGHIEDVVVDKDYQGKGIGRQIILYLLDIAEKRGCYKTVLDCKDDVKKFYEGIGFKHESNGLRYDHV